jgi:hypothetical protein
VTPIQGATDARRLELTIRGATDRLVTVSELAPGRYRWEVLVPGQPSHAGVVEVPAVPAQVEVVPVAVAEEPTGPAAPANTAGGGSEPAPDDGDDVRQPIGVSDGPNQPVDPDGD